MTAGVLPNAMALGVYRQRFFASIRVRNVVEKPRFDDKTEDEIVRNTAISDDFRVVYSANLLPVFS